MKTTCLHCNEKFNLTDANFELYFDGNVELPSICEKCADCNTPFQEAMEIYADEIC